MATELPLTPPDRRPAGGLRGALAWLWFPLLIGGSTALTYALAARGWAMVPAFSLVSLGLLLVVAWLERVFPHREDWLPSDGQLWNDLGHSLLGTALGAGSGEKLTQLAMGAASLSLAAWAGHGLWPSQLPFWAQVVLLYLLADLGRYVQHRLLHQVPWLWRFHALHHGVTRLNALKTSRSHVVERFLQPMFMFGLIYLLGAPQEVIYAYMVPNSFLGILDHSNLEVQLGPLSYVIQGPAEHRLHHSSAFGESQRNFGSALVVWDLAFGTYGNPRPHGSPLAVGIEGEVLPPGFWAQFWGPFRGGG